jgi:RimJ/RimL family protein N-acetyltransferase
MILVTTAQYRLGGGKVHAVLDAGDNWLDLKRLELTVYVDNEPAIRLSKKPRIRGRGHAPHRRVPRRRIRRHPHNGTVAER